MLSARNADYLGWPDRGRTVPGLRADFNLVDPAARWRCARPTYCATCQPVASALRSLRAVTWAIVGRAGGTTRNGQVSDARPGRLVRAGPV